MHTRPFVSLPIIFLSTLCSAQTKPVEGITFDHNPAIYLAAKDLGEALNSPIDFNAKTGKMKIGDLTTPSSTSLPDGTKLVLLRDLGNAGATVDWDPVSSTGHLTWRGKTVDLRVGPKRAVVDISKQQLDAYQGDLLVFSTHVSTGKLGKPTPTGQYVAGFKSKLHHSSLYNNAPMPWSVQVNGNIFIHGFKSVPSRPASHGCIRVPIKAARWFYRWIDSGTPVSIEGEWAPPVKTEAKPAS